MEVTGLLNGEGLLAAALFVLFRLIKLPADGFKGLDQPLHHCRIFGKSELHPRIRGTSQLINGHRHVRVAALQGDPWPVWQLLDFAENSNALRQMLA